MKQLNNHNACRAGGCGCSEVSASVFEEKIVARQKPKREIEIEFLYLDLNVCEQCKGTESNLEEALSEVSAVLEKTGIRVNLKKTQIESFEQALELGFISSPTIRINERDVQFEVRENYCSSCSELSGDETYCRVWSFGGEEFSAVPKSLVIESVLKEIYGAPENSVQKTEISRAGSEGFRDNLKRFFEGRKALEESRGMREEITARLTLNVPALRVEKAEGCGCQS